MDSVRPEVLDHFAALGTTVCRTCSQDMTDFEKALMWLDVHGALDAIVVFGAFGGRLDHTIANISALYARHDVVGRAPQTIVLVGDDSLATLLPAGRSTVRVDPRIEGPTCGLLPMRGAPRVSTVGLKWDLLDNELRLGGLISSSNALHPQNAECIVHIRTTQPLLWTTEWRPVAAVHAAMGPINGPSPMSAELREEGAEGERRPSGSTNAH